MEEDTPRCHVCGSTDKMAQLDGSVESIVLVVCISCKRYFCPTHTSEFDQTICSTCVNYESVGIKRTALVDDEGVTHRGSQLILTGEAWMRNRDIISKMTDSELEGKLIALQRAVHEAEMVLDYRRIAHSQVENERSGRLSKKLSRLRLISAVDHAHKSATKPNDETKKQNSEDHAHKSATKPNGETKKQNNEVNETKKQNSEVNDALKALSKLGLNKDAIANVLLKLAQQKKAT